MREERGLWLTGGLLQARDESVTVVAAVVEASRAKRRELRGEASGWRETRGESERES